MPGTETQYGCLPSSCMRTMQSRHKTIKKKTVGVLINCEDFKENAAHSFGHFNTWSPVAFHFWGGLCGTALLEEERTRAGLLY